MADLGGLAAIGAKTASSRFREVLYQRIKQRRNNLDVTSDLMPAQGSTRAYTTPNNMTKRWRLRKTLNIDTHKNIHYTL